MAFRDFPAQRQGIELLQRSLERGRLAHAYLFNGEDIVELEGLARTLAKTLNCQNPARGKSGAPLDSCDECLNCRKVEHGNHADVHWIRPESKSRIVTIDQVRDLMRDINLKPTEAEYKTAIVVGADRLRVEAANAFLKTLEEPPAKSILVLLTTDSQRILETIISRCLRLNFAGDYSGRLDPAQAQWLQRFSEMASVPQKSLLGRYRLLDLLLQKLNEFRAAIEENLKARSPLEQYEDVDKDLRERWEEELKAAVEAEYRRQRADLLQLVQRWFRDVWVHTLPTADAEASERLMLPQVAGAQAVAQRLTPAQAVENLSTLEDLQQLLHTNVQEALALEVGLLKLHL